MSKETFISSHVVQPAVLTAATLALGVTLSFFFSWTYVALYLAVLPFPLFLLWMTSQVESPALRIAAVDAAAHARVHP